jgi:hypothetical protein
MAHLLLPDFDHLAGAPGTAVAIVSEQLDMSAHEFAETTSKTRAH